MSGNQLWEAAVVAMDLRPALSPAACPGKFMCNTGRCIRNELRCDGWADCADYSDELNCSEWGAGRDVLCPCCVLVPTSRPLREEGPRWLGGCAHAHVDIWTPSLALLWSRQWSFSAVLRSASSASDTGHPTHSPDGTVSSGSFQGKQGAMRDQGVRVPLSLAS